MLITGLQDDGLVCRLILADNAVAAVSSATGMLDKTLVHQKTNIASDSALGQTAGCADVVDFAAWVAFYVQIYSSQFGIMLKIFSSGSLFWKKCVCFPVCFL